MAADDHRKRTPHGTAALAEDRDPVVVPLTAATGGGEAHGAAHTGDSTASSPQKKGFVPTARGIWLGTKILAGGLTASWLIAWPIGMTLVHRAQTGTFAIQLGYGPDMLFMALATVGLILGGGYALAAGVRLEAAAQRLTTSMSSLGAGVFPLKGAGGQPHLKALNAEIDQALEKLAEAESVIRQQVRWLDSTTSAINTGVMASTDRLEAATKTLMAQTEEVNREAERCAETIAEQTRLASDASDTMGERLDQKSNELDSQLQRLETVSTRSLERFENLAGMMEDRSASLVNVSAETTERQSAIASQLDDNQQRLEAAQDNLLAQSERLEGLIRDQRRRAEKLAKVVTDHSSRTTAAPTAPLQSDGAGRQGRSWRDILATVEGALPKHSAERAPAPARAPSPPIAAIRSGAPDGPRPSDIDRLVVRVQNFSLVLQTQLFGGPTHDELDRFENGERQIFVRALLEHDPESLKNRIRAELSKNDVFSQRVHEYLSDFDALLAPLASGGEEAIEAYLAAPVGRLFVLVGEAADHF